MQLRMLFLIALIFAEAASAQTPDEGLRSKIRAVHYPRLAEQARIQGVVHLNVKSGVVSVVGGHPLLYPTAIESAKVLGSIQGNTDVEMTYHFVLVDNTTSVPTRFTVPRGNVFERAVLRVFGRKTVRVLVEDRCEEGAPPANDVRIAGAVVEVWILGQIHCLQVDRATLLAERQSGSRGSAASD